MKDEVDFLPADKRQRFLQSYTIILDVCDPAFQITQNKKIDFSLQYQCLQTDTMILMGMDKYSQSSQNSKFAMSLQYFKRGVRDEVDFLHADKHQSFLSSDFNTSVIKVSYKVILSILVGMIKHSQSTQNNKFVISLQYFKKQNRNGVDFLHADKH